MGGFSFWAPTDISRSANIPMSRSSTRETISSSLTSKQARYIDCNQMPLPFGPQFVADVVNRTHVAQDQAGCLLAAELVIKAQRDAQVVTLKD